MKKNIEIFIKLKAYFKSVRFLLFSFIIIFSFLSFSTKASANTYYVATTGLDTNAGTLALPFKTITKGITVAVAGDTVLVKAGIYKEYVQFTNSGTVGNPITLKNYNTDVVTIDAENIRYYCLYAIDQSNIVIDGINVKNSIAYNVRFDGSQNITYKNSSSNLAVSPSVSYINIIISSSSTNWGQNITLQNITTNGGEYGIYFGGGRVDGVNISGGSFNYAAIDGINISVESITDPAKFTRNVVVDGVETSYNLRQGIVTWGLNGGTFRNFHSHHNGATGIQIENYSSNILIEDFITDNNSLSLSYTFETGVWIDDTDTATIRRGILRDNSTGYRVSGSKNILAYDLLIYSNQDGSGEMNSSGVSFMDSYDTSTPCVNVQLYNSVIYGNSSLNSQRSSVTLQGSGNYILKNNIISNDLSAYDIYRTGSNTLISDNNLIYNSRVINIYYNTDLTHWTADSTWLSYKSATGQEAHSMNTNPLFIDPTNNNFNLQPTSPAINAGVSVGLTTDYLGNPIVGTPDIGAYEYQEVTAPTTYTISYSANTGGTITGTLYQTVSSGVNGTQVTAVPTTGYTFSSWSDGITTASRTETNVVANKTIIATFTIIPTSGGGGGGGSVTPPTTTPVTPTAPVVTTPVIQPSQDKGCNPGNTFSITTGKLCPKTNTPSINKLKLTKTLRYASYFNDRNQVKILQQILVSKGYLTGTADGIFGRATLASVKAFQTANGLTPDGVVGAGTREVLNR